MYQALLLRFPLTATSIRRSCALRSSVRIRTRHDQLHDRRETFRPSRETWSSTHHTLLRVNARDDNVKRLRDHRLHLDAERSRRRHVKCQRSSSHQRVFTCECATIVENAFAFFVRRHFPRVRHADTVIKIFFANSFSRNLLSTFRISATLCVQSFFPTFAVRFLSLTWRSACAKFQDTSVTPARTVFFVQDSPQRYRVTPDETDARTMTDNTHARSHISQRRVRASTS